MKLLSILGVMCACLIVGISIVLVLQSPTRKPLTDDDTILVGPHTIGNDTESVTRGDFTHTRPLLQEDPKKWYEDRKTEAPKAKFTVSNKQTPTNTDDLLAVEDTLPSETTEQSTNKSDSIVSSFIDNFWGDRNNTSSTPQQEGDPVKNRIHEYGNQVGKVIQTFVQEKTSTQNEILGAYVVSPSKNDSLKPLEQAYTELANSIDAINAPDAFQESQKKLSAGYLEVAKGLSTLGTSTSQTVYQNMLMYNSHVETFGAAFISYAQLFGAFGVTFSQDEPGGIFTPPVAAF